MENRRTIKNEFGKEIQIWNPSTLEEKEVREKWATYNSPETLTTVKILRKYKISRLMFFRWAELYDVHPKGTQANRPPRDMANYIRIPVMDRLGRETNLVVKPGTNIEQAINRYYERQKLRAS